MIADGYKDTEIGVIPTEWDVELFENLKFDVSDGNYSSKYPKQSDFIKEGIPFIRANNIKNMTVINKDMRYISANQHSELKKGHLKKGDILITTRGDIGQIALVPDKFIDANINAQIVRIGASDRIYNKYLAYFLTQQHIQNIITSLETGTALKQLPVGKLGLIPISLPPLKEQEKIADILSTADAKIDAIASQIEKAETLKKGLLQKLLSEGIGHSEFKDTGLNIVYQMRKIPKAWELKTLSDITTKITDGAHFTPTYVESGIPFLRVTDLKSKDLLASNIKYIPEEEHIELLKRCNPEYGDILYSKNGTIGLTRIVTWDWEFSIFVSLCLIKPNKDLIISEYLKYYLTSSIVNTQIMIRAKQGAVTNLHLEEIRDFFITIPPLEEQKQIADILSTADEKLEVLRDKKEKYETLKKGLLQKLLSGEVRV